MNGKRDEGKGRGREGEVKGGREGERETKGKDGKGRNGREKDRKEGCIKERRIRPSGRKEYATESKQKIYYQHVTNARSQSLRGV